MSEFDRNVWCLLGIPVDVVSFEQATDLITSAAISGAKCFFSTPNLNFIIEARNDDVFRNSVICSDLVLLDGMPPVWIARLLGIPAIEKVSGSDLFEAVRRCNPCKRNKIRVFLFGGEEGIAKLACERINEPKNILECIGFHNPGFGSVEAMSSEDMLKKINDSKPDFLLVSLGAKKGQAWIMANKAKLDVPVISHLGAVINFTAGQISRAPGWIQVSGFEWLWRTWQEPNLWRRYLFDGLSLCWLMVFRVLPFSIWMIFHRSGNLFQAPLKHKVVARGNLITIYLEGECLYQTIDPLRELFYREAGKNCSIRLDLTAVTKVDSAFIGLCLVLYKHAVEKRFSLSFRGLNDPVKRIFRWNCVEYLLQL